MKQLITYLLLAGMLLGLAGCRLNYMEPEEMQDFLDGVVENIGDSQITDDKNLIGTRTMADSDDAYAGVYTAECESVTGRDVIFGGASTGVVCDGNVITGIGMFFREFAEAVLQRFEYDIGNNYMRDKPEDYTEEELTFFWSEEDYREFLEELKEYQP